MVATAYAYAIAYTLCALIIIGALAFMGDIVKKTHRKLTPLRRAKHRPARLLAWLLEIPVCGASLAFMAIAVFFVGTNVLIAMPQAAPHLKSVKVVIPLPGASLRASW